ncbi:hypothetical protein ABHF33_08235 [Chitinibacter sp. FCG-7]|uniref:DUF3592 domain-containing protein n=1 Tax=Chitinibacter mangrovi TaxID=3153927 RepID=A0AAU7FBW1_9NEIS
MTLYFTFIGYGSIVLALWLLAYRIRFVLTATRITGTVRAVVTRNSLTEGTQSRHLKIAYRCPGQHEADYIADNSLLVYLYRAGEPIKLAVKNQRVIVNTPLNLLAAPTVLFAMGAITLYTLVP